MSVSLIRSFRTHRLYAISTRRVKNSYRKNKYIFFKSKIPPPHFFAPKLIIKNIDRDVAMFCTTLLNTELQVSETRGTFQISGHCGKFSTGKMRKFEIRIMPFGLKPCGYEKG